MKIMEDVVNLCSQRYEKFLKWKMHDYSATTLSCPVNRQEDK
jgi:hypothetical protein